MIFELRHCKVGKMDCKLQQCGVEKMIFVIPDRIEVRALDFNA